MYKIVNGVPVELSPEEHEAIVAEWAANSESDAAIAYRKRRKAEYPDIGDQLDAIWKMLDDKDEDAMRMIAIIKDIKVKYPKPGA